MYMIKKIRWLDANANQKLRVSPILIQNSNGPCPLLALVNALTLSSPSDIDTPIVDTLRSREQVSLGLLLDAVFDELTSECRSDSLNQLTDFTDLYSFLVTLHMGMNVNPCFFPTATSDVHEQPASHDSNLKGRGPTTGFFENTREMRLYSTFDVSLIHGWLPEPSSPEYTALFRSARTYEDAQNAMLLQESLEAQLSGKGLDPKEQILLEDISIIKAFFDSNQTQLTPYGLDAIKSSFAPGTVAIFFRNNHFSTIYRQPKTLQLLQLVTDIGYAKNDIVVWESLTDVTGENSQFYSGDFQLVSGDTATIPNPLTSGDNMLSQESSLSLEKNLDLGSYNESKYIQSSEQKDQDLALALLLQDEEEKKHPTVIDQPYSKTEISQLKAAQPGQWSKTTNETAGESVTAISPRRGYENRPKIPPRRSTMNLGNRHDSRTGRAVVEAGPESPPPSYEVAATQQPYLPPNSHSSNLDTSSDHPYGPPSSSSGSKNPNSAPKTRGTRRLISHQEIIDKIVNVQERGQKECSLM